MSFVKGCFLANRISLIKFILTTCNFTTLRRKCLIIKQSIPLLLLFGFASIGAAQTPTTKPNVPAPAIVVHGCTGLTIKDNNLQLTGDESTPAMDIRNVEDLTERQNKVT